jgi:hypothetical protein
MDEQTKQDLEFMQEVREASDAKLDMLLRWQACEVWRRVAILREQDRRRQTGTRPERQEKANDTANEGGDR